MLKKSLKYPKIALINTKNIDFFGYRLVLDQEKIPYFIVDSIKSEFDVVILPKDNTLTVKAIIDYVRDGGSVIASWDYLQHEKGFSSIINAGVSSFTPFGDGVLYYFNKNFGEEVLRHQNFSSPVSRNIFSQMLSYSLGHSITENNKRQDRIILKNVLYRLVGPLTQISYWPDHYQACFCQRVDVDFPLAQFYHKDKIITEMFKIIGEFNNINFTLFLNHSFPKQIEKINILASSCSNVELQSHGCDDKIKHKDYCYSLNLLNKEEIENMLVSTVVGKGYKIFAPPCEQVNETVLKCCSDLNIRYISAGGMGKDDLPRKCFYEGKEYEILNIPTSEKEFLDEPDYNEQYYSNLFHTTIKDSSLFCIYFHPAILLKSNPKKIISKFLYYNIMEEQRKGKLWTPFMSELAQWWHMRDNTNIMNGDLVFNDERTRNFFSESNKQLSIIKWYPDHTKKIA